MEKILEKNYRVLQIALTLFFLAITLPLYNTRPAGGDRSGQTAGIIRIYCQEPGRSSLKGPHIHFGKNPFNLEWTIVEKLQGALVRALDHSNPDCDSVEVVAKTTSILFGALSVFALIWVSTLLWGKIPGLISGLILATDALWLRYSTYTFIEHRTMAIALLAIAFSLKRWYFLAFSFWTFTLLQKPQAFSFLVGIWVCIELLRIVLEKRKIDYKLVLVLFGALFIGGSYMIWSSTVNESSDLPWIQWMGPRSRAWFIGNWSDRFTIDYWKGQLLLWNRKTGVFYFAVLALILSRKKQQDILSVFKASFPFLFALLGYTFVFYHVYIVHEYYSLPLNLGAALFLPGVFWVFFKSVSDKKTKIVVFSLFLVGMVLVPSITNLKKYAYYFKNIENPESESYLHEWNVPVFPKRNVFAVIANENGREVYPLYFARARGFAWCAKNKEFAPRAYWASQGVEYVAWAKSYDTKLKRILWQVNSMKEELEWAKKMGWSSDVNDVWSSRSMKEWAALASKTARDPCLYKEDFDPRLWIDKKVREFKF